MIIIPINIIAGGCSSRPAIQNQIPIARPITNNYNFSSPVNLGAELKSQLARQLAIALAVREGQQPTEFASEIIINGRSHIIDDATN